MTHSWYPLYPSDVEYSVAIDSPHLKDSDHRVWATDSQEAARTVCEQLADDEAVDMEIAATWISPAVRVPRGA